MRRLAGVMVAVALCGACAGGGEKRVESDVPMPQDAAEDAAADGFAAGQELAYTDEGFVPATLLALVGEDVHIANRSATPQRFRFGNYTTPDGRTETGEIGPGQRFTFRPDHLSSIVVLTAGESQRRGVIQVENDALSDGERPPP